MAYTNTSNQIISITISYFVSTDIPSFMLMMMTMNNLSSSVSNASHFLTQYNRLNNDYINLADFWNDVEFKAEPNKMFPTNDLHISHIYVDRGAFKLQLDTGLISLAPGEKIYIDGPTGGGKSTLVKAILGLISGANTNRGKPENYYHHVVNYFQEIKEKLPSSEISIRDYFKDETNDQIIEE